MRDDVGIRVGQRIDAPADRIAHVRRSQQRQHEERPAWHAPNRQCLAEVLVERGGLFAGDIQDAEARHHVHGDAAGGVHEAVDVALQERVHHHDRRIQDLENIAHAHAERFRDVIDIEPGHRPENGPVEKHVELEEHAVDRLDRVRDFSDRIAFRLRGARTAGQDRHDHDRGGKRLQAFPQMSAQQRTTPLPVRTASGNPDAVNQACRAAPVTLKI